MSGTASPAPRSARIASAAEIGGELKLARLALGLSISEVASDLRIRPRYLEAIEAGDTSSAPGPVYLIGFARAYASRVGLSPDAVATRLSTAMRAVRASTANEAPVSIPRRGSPSKAMLAAGAAILVAVHYGWIAFGGGSDRVTDGVPQVPERLFQQAAVSQDSASP